MTQVLRANDTSLTYGLAGRLQLAAAVTQLTPLSLIPVTEPNRQLSLNSSLQHTPLSLIPVTEPNRQLSLNSSLQHTPLSLIPVTEPNRQLSLNSSLQHTPLSLIPIDVLNKDCRRSCSAILTWILEYVKISALPLNSIGN